MQMHTMMDLLQELERALTEVDLGGKGTLT
jgi:hypothetical protein